MNVTTLENVHPEVRAFIYQQLADLEGLLPDGSTIAVFIDDRDKEHITASIELVTPYGEIKADEESTSVYESLAGAKDDILRQIGELRRSSEDSDSAMENIVQTISNKKQLH